MIYIVEDDRNIQEIEIFALKNSGYQAVGFETAKDFYKALSEKLPELILLDIMLPDEDGLSILKNLRTRADTQKIPVILVTAKSTEIDKVKGLDGGADDYVTKPFGTMELIARVKALLRRADVTAAMDTGDYHNGALYLNPAKHIIQVNGKDVVLTLKEFQLLCYLVKNKGNVMTRDRILQEIWGYEFDGENRTVDVHIRTLRTKLGEAGSLVETVRGIGYRIGGRSV